MTDPASVTDRNLPYGEIVAPAARSEARLNDVPLYRFDGANAYRVFVPAFTHLVLGANEFELRFTAPLADDDQPAMTGRVALFGDGEQAFVGGQTLSSLTLTGPARSVQDRFVSPMGSASLPWASSPALSDVDRLNLPSFLTELQTALDTANAGPILAAAGPKISHCAAAYQKGVAEIRDSMVAVIQGLGVATRPLEAPRLVADPCGYGRLIQPLGPDDQPWLRRWKGDGTLFYYPVLVGRNGSAWQIFL